MPGSWKLGIVMFFFAGTALAQTQDEQLAAIRILLQNGHNDAAISRLEEIAVRQPALPGLQRLLGLAYYARADYLTAIDHLNLALRQNQHDRDAAQLLGLAYYLTGRPTEAIPYLLQSEPRANEHPVDAAYTLALCYALSHQHDQALHVLSKLYELRPDSPAAHLIFAKTMLLQGLDSVAEREARSVLQMVPAMPNAHLVLGQTALYRGDLPEATDEFRAELELDPANARALVRLGEAHSRAGRWSDAQVVVQRSISLDPTSPESYILLCKILLHNRDFVQAQRAAQRAATIDSRDYTAHYLLSEAYLQMGQSELARHEMQIAVRLEQQRAASKNR